MTLPRIHDINEGRTRAQFEASTQLTADAVLLAQALLRAKRSRPRGRANYAAIDALLNMRRLLCPLEPAQRGAVVTVMRNVLGPVDHEFEGMVRDVAREPADPFEGL